MGTDPHEADPPAWLDVEDVAPAPAPGRSSRTPWLFVAATLPWLVVGVLLVRGDGPERAAVAAAPTTPPVVAAADGDEQVDVDVPVPSPGGDDEPGAAILGSGALVAVDEDEARAVAVVAARRWLTTVGPDAGPDGPDVAADAEGDADAGLYAEHLVVEGVDHPAPGAAVVTVRAIVLRVAGDAYEAMEVRRVAVPLRFDAGGAVPAGTPYLLPHADATAEPFAPTEAIEDPDLLLLAGEALAEAGYADVSVRSLHRTSSWPLVATADVRAGGTPARTVAVWLRPHLGRLVVAGTRPRPPVDRVPTDLPSSSEPAHDHEEVAP